jgi:hypothetical protein
MALDGSYGGLKASIADFLGRTDLTAAIPDFITLAEAQMTRRLVGRTGQGLPAPRRLVQRSDAGLAAGVEFLAVPDDFHGPIEFLLQGSPEIVLDYLDPTVFQQWKEAGSLAGRPPAYFTVVGGEFQFYPVADKTYAAELTYIQRFPALSTANSSNWILADYPDAYLYGALVQSAPYLKDDNRATVWGTLFTAALDDICNADPVPADKSTLRMELAMLTRSERLAHYDINSDNF